MDNIKLKTLPYEFHGRRYELVCNYNVISDLIEEFGNLPDLLDQRMTFKVYTATLAAMLNDYADSMRWPDRFTPRQIGREIDMRHLPNEDIQAVLNLLVSALYEPSTDGEEIESKN